MGSSRYWTRQTLLEQRITIRSCHVTWSSTFCLLHLYENDGVYHSETVPEVVNATLFIVITSSTYMGSSRDWTRQTKSTRWITQWSCKVTWWSTFCLLHRYENDGVYHSETVPQVVNVTLFIVMTGSTYMGSSRDWTRQTKSTRWITKWSCKVPWWSSYQKPKNRWRRLQTRAKHNRRKPRPRDKRQTRWPSDVALDKPSKRRNQLSSKLRNAPKQAPNKDNSTVLGIGLKGAYPAHSAGSAFADTFYLFKKIKI